MTNSSSDGDIKENDFKDVSSVVKFLVDLVMRLTSSPKIPLSAQNYAHAIGPALDEFLTEHGDALAVGGGDNGSDLKKAVERLTKSAEVKNNCTKETVTECMIHFLLRPFTSCTTTPLTSSGPR